MSATATTMKKFEATENTASPVGRSKIFYFNVSLYEHQGHAWMSWQTSYPGFVRLAVAIFNGAVPSNPNYTWINALEITGQVSGSWDSGQVWGSGYSGALLGVTPNNAVWMDIGVDTPVTSN
jgi:hypothetical protein